MNLKKTLQLLAVAGLIGFTALPLHAQVTIGSGIEPLPGALLDLKEKTPADPATDNTTATKGLMLPRVKLTNSTDITVDITGVTAADKDIYTGLTVYNMGQCDGKFAQGVYTWTGTQWVQLTNNPILTTNPTLAFTPALPADAIIRIPSGQDLRAAWTAVYAPSIAFTSAGLMSGAWANTVSSGLLFTANPLAPAFPATWTVSPVNNISIWPDAMAATDLASNPFLTRESTLTLTAQPDPASPCPGGTPQTQVISLNQTNYAIIPGTVASPVSLLVLRATGQQNQNILSNVQWQATASTGTVPYTDILSSYTTAQTGSERHNGGYNTNTFNYTGTNPVVQGKKYETAQITFNDVDGRAKPATVTVMQCQGTIDLSGVMTATDNNDPNWQTNWGTNVVHHPAKAGVYEEFYSAYFGAAGRWMTTNLAATAYDGIYHSTDPAGTATSGSGNPRTLTGPDMTSASASNTAYWCYPGASITTGGTNNTDYLNNPQIGYLYTWDAATAGKGGASGTGNSQNEGGLPYGTSTLPDGSTITVTQIQGVCPAGWHLPSDYEWTALENEIIRSTTSYAYESSNISPDGSTGLLTGTETGLRGTTHGRAMKDICGLNGINPNGTSKSLETGGFSVLLTGQVLTGSSNVTLSNFGTNAGFWSSSSINSSTGAWYRNLPNGNTRVGRNTWNRYDQYSVRCKKND